MSRTDNKKQRTQKKQQKTQNSERFVNPRERLSLSDAKDSGVVIAQTNGVGNTYHWFTKGRKACWETKMNFDKDGYRSYKRGDTWQSTKMMLPSRAKKRLRKL